MLTVLLVWIYVTALAGILGYGCIRFVCSLPLLTGIRSGRESFYHVRYKENYVVAGIVILTVYAQIWSLFGGVGLWANVVLILLCALIVLRYLHHAGFRGISFVTELTFKKYSWLYLFLFLLFAYGTSHGYSHYDTGLYHAQAIHWIETYGVVKGLGNLHTRLAYNSAAFPLSALFSFSFLGGQSLHTMAGYFAMLLSLKCVDLVQLGQRRHPALPDGARLIAIYYLFTIFDDMVSPASDYFVLTILLYILITWLDLDLAHEHSATPYGILAVLAVYAVTLKLSAAPFLLLALKPIVMILREKPVKKTDKKSMKGRKAGKILFFFLSGVLVALPYLVRNVILSGWLLYPATALDLFRVDWKIPKGIADYDAHEICVYGRGFTDVTRYSEPISIWFPGWFAGIGKTNQLLFALDMAAFVLYVILLLVLFAGWRRRQIHLKKQRQMQNQWSVQMLEDVRQWEQQLYDKVVHISKRRMVRLRDFLFLETVLYAQLFYWLLSSPLIRYGSLFLYLPGPLMLYRIFTFFFYRREEKKKHEWGRILVVCIMAFLVYKGGRLVLDDVRIFSAKNLLVQQDYASYECETYEIDGVTFYHPVEGNQAGYEPFPSTPVLSEARLLGEEITDGFYTP